MPRLKNDNERPPLGDAIRRVRQACGWSQQALAEKLGTAVMTLSKWERDLFRPRNAAVLRLLRSFAYDAQLAKEEKQFSEALKTATNSPISARFEPQAPSPLEWRMMQMARLIVDYFPELLPAFEAAAGPVAALVDEVMAEVNVGERRVSVQFYLDLERRLHELAAQRVFQGKKQMSTEGESHLAPDR